jgi:hypothetical protein
MNKFAVRGFKPCTVCYSGNPMKGGEMDRECRTRERCEKCTNNIGLKNGRDRARWEI